MVEFFFLEKEIQMCEKLFMIYWICCLVVCSIDFGKGYLINDMIINFLIVENFCQFSINDEGQEING